MMFFFIWFGSAKKAFIAMCIVGGITVLALLGSLVCVFFDMALATVLLFVALPFALFTLLYLFNWLMCRRSDKKRLAAYTMQQAQQYQQIQQYQQAAAQPVQPYQQYQQAAAQPVQPYQQYPQAAIQPEQKPAKLPGQGFVKAGLILGLIGLALILIIGIGYTTTKTKYYSESAFLGDLILLIIVMCICALSVLLGRSAKRRKYPKKTVSAVLAIGYIGTGLSILIIIISAIMAYS